MTPRPPRARRRRAQIRRALLWLAAACAFVATAGDRLLSFATTGSRSALFAAGVLVGFWAVSAVISTWTAE